MKMAHLFRVRALLIVLVHFLATSATAQVDCTNADNLCTGDPCVIPSVEIVGPCTVDFGTRALVIAGTLRTPVFADIDFSAGSIRVDGRILASDTSEVHLSASSVFVLKGEYRGTAATDLLVDAGGDVELDGRLTLSSPPLGSGTMTVDAGGLLTVSKQIKSDGFLFLKGAQGVHVKAPIRARMTFTDLIASGGGITIDAPIGFRPCQAKRTRAPSWSKAPVTS